MYFRHYLVYSASNYILSSYSIPGWDKIFHFVGANTFSQKFRLKQRESDTTKDSKTAIIWVFLRVTRNVFLWQDISVSDKKFHTVTRNFFLWQEMSNYGMKFLPVPRNFFLWQEISALNKRFLSVTISFFLWQLSLLAVPTNFFLLQENISCMLCVVWKNFCIWQEIRTLKSNLHQNSVNCCINFVGVWRFCGAELYVIIT